MGIFVLFKATNRVNNREYYGIHETIDAFYGTDMASDVSMPSAAEIAADIRKYGRNAFAIEAIHGFGDQQSALAHRARYIKNASKNSYHHVSEERREARLGAAWTQEQREIVSERLKGEKNPFYGKKHAPEVNAAHSQFRSNTLWVNNGFEERQILKSDPIPNGWKRGRRPNLMAKFRKTPASANVSMNSQV